jgi:hypothetical protein
MAILDNELAIATTVAVDLGVSGAGNPIKLQAAGVTTTVVVTSSATVGGTYAGSTTFTCGGADFVECQLPSYTKQFIKCVFADGSVEVILNCGQTNI